jgi:2-polyprenyl-6-methoxyphenol hydroxylase-like FAD-dependent oxidoreductase
MRPQIVIVGGGPAGMVLAYQLVTNGIAVRVLEQHPDFDREFRGELLGPSVLPALEDLGILPILTERGLARTGVEPRMFVGGSRRVTLPGGSELGAMVSQPGMLALLHELSSRYPHYQMDFRASGRRAIVEGERVVALEARREGREERIEGDLFIVCSGRNSILRTDLGGELELAEKPDNTIWLRVDLSDAPEALPESVDVHMFGKGVVLVFFATVGKPHLQIAYSAPGDLGALRKDLPALRAAVLPLLPEPLRAHVAARLDATTKTQFLKVSIDRLKRWHVPGLLFLGDAAHTMSPAGGQGLNLAIRDSIVAANHLIDALREGRTIDSEILSRIEAERRPEIEMAQAGQLRAHGMVHKPAFVQHIMFSILKIVMLVKKFTTPVSPPVMPRHALRATTQTNGA